MVMNLRPREAAKVLGIGLSTFWLKAKTDPEFPKIIRLSPKAVVVRESDIAAYIEKKASVPHVPNPPKVKKAKKGSLALAE